MRTSLLNKKIQLEIFRIKWKILTCGFKYFKSLVNIFMILARNLILNRVDYSRFRKAITLKFSMFNENFRYNFKETWEIFPNKGILKIFN